MGDVPIPEYQREDWAPRQQQLREAAAQAQELKAQVFQSPRKSILAEFYNFGL